MKTLRIGLVGLDTSHVTFFASLLNNARDPDHVPGGMIVAGYPGGSPDFPLSADRVAGFTQQLQENYGMVVRSSPREVAAEVDAILHTTVDGRRHLAEFTELAPFRRPVFIDKPFAVTSADARAIAGLAAKHGTPVFSSSSLRFAGALQTTLADNRDGPIIGADFYGPMNLQPTQPGFFWYGIHTAEMLYVSLGRGCEKVRTVSTPEHDIAIGTWRDGRIGIIRGNRAGNGAFGGTLHRTQGSQSVDIATGRRPDIGLTIAIMDFFQGGPPPVAIEETLELVQFLEAANTSREHGGVEVRLGSL